ncbi:MAG: hypothetical protein GY765_13900 [bacterium]|nr:hypothetical protein [bacterium]
MKIKSIGTLHWNPDIPEWLDSEEIQIPFLWNQLFAIAFQDIEDDSAPQEFEQAINNFLELNEKNRKDTNPYIFAEYKNVVKSVGKEAFNFTIADDDSVWEYVTPTHIYVSRRSGVDNAVYIQIAAECRWEMEHGLQIVYKQGNILKRVSSQDGKLTNSDAYARPELENEIRSTGL